MGTMCIKTSRKTKIKVARSGRGGPAENKSLKLETEEQRQEPVEQNREAGQNPPRVVACTCTFYSGVAGIPMPSQVLGVMVDFFLYSH
jgi:hypothetical protein